MLTADLVCARIQGGRLQIQRLDGPRRARALALAELLLAVARERLGAAREELREAWRECEQAARERKLVQGLCKLIEDAAEFAEPEGEVPVELRREVFLRAAAAAREAATESLRVSGFDRAAVLAAVAAERGTTVEAIEAALYADLRGAQPLLAVAPESAAALVERYEQASVQAVLLRAVRVTARIEASPSAARALFHKLKFHRLLHRIERVGEGSFQLTIDGPYSLFDAVTKYGLELGLVLPALEAAERLELEAEVRWGAARRAVTFQHSVRRPRVAGAAEPPRLGVDAQELLEAFATLSTRWSAAPASVVLELPGVGVVVPDLVFSHPALDGPIYLEVLGYWSRAAVWRRVELVEAGLPERLLFAVSSRLRVSEEVLDGHDSAALYVFKGTMSARAVERKLEALRRPATGS